MDGPDSSYSCFEIHICWKVERDAKMEPPIQTEYFLSGGVITLIFIVGGAKAVISFCIWSGWEHGRTTRQHSVGIQVFFDINIALHDYSIVSWIPADSIPRNDGWKSASGSQNRLLPTVITWPSGNS